jgi:hypothetical protein
MTDQVMSARELGAKVGMTAEAFNRLLRDQGILTGDPGAYGLTGKGADFAVQVDHDNGYGGVAYRAWTTTHFDPSLMEVIDTSPEKIAGATTAVMAARTERATQTAAARAMAEEAFLASQKVPDFEYEFDTQKVLLLVGGVIVVIGGVVLWVNRDEIKRKWNEVGAPRMASLRERLTQSSRAREGSGDDDPADADIGEGRPDGHGERSMVPNSDDEI